MNKTISNIKTKITGKPTDVSAVLGIFNTAITQLQSVVAHHQDNRVKQQDAIAKAQAAQDASESQIAQANTALSNIRSLLGK